MDIAPGYVELLAPKIAKAFADMESVESGAIANPDEGRMVGHYWLRNATLAPTEELRRAITDPIDDLKRFAEKIHTGAISPPTGGHFKQVLLIGIGGSALGPQLVSEAIGQNVRLPLHFFDNTDPAGMDTVIERLAKTGLDKTLVLVISKSGGTAETRNGMLEAKAAYEAAASTSAATPPPSPVSAPSSTNTPSPTTLSRVSQWKTGSEDALPCSPPSASSPPRCKA